MRGDCALRNIGVKHRPIRPLTHDQRRSSFVSYCSYYEKPRLCFATLLPQAELAIVDSYFWGAVRVCCRLFWTFESLRDYPSTTEKKNAIDHITIEMIALHRANIR